MEQTMLPLIMANGTFKRLNSLEDDEIESFLSYLVRFSAEKFSTDPSQVPLWWNENVLFPPSFYQGSVPLPHTRNKHAKMRHLVKLCYTFYNCKELLNLSEKLASLHVFSYKFDRSLNGTVTVYNVNSHSPLVTIPSSNLDYDLKVPLHSETSNTNIIQQPTVTIFPRKTLIPLLRGNGTKASSDDDSNCIVIDDSSSDDEVQIVSYDPEAFRPTPPRIQRLIPSNKPGPACSKKLQKPVKRLSVPTLKFEPPSSSTPRLPSQDRVISSFNHKPFKECQVHLHKRALSNRYTKIRTQPKQNQALIQIDLTSDDDIKVEHIKKVEVPPALAKDEFFASLSLFPKGTPLPQSAPEQYCFSSSPRNANTRFSLKKLSFDQVPFLVRMGILPKRTMCSLQELVNRDDFIKKYTRGDTELKTIVIDVRNKAAVAKLTKKCSVKVKRLRSADFRKWKKKRSLLPDL